jgi:hypothetical protein
MSNARELKNFVNESGNPGFGFVNDMMKNQLDFEDKMESNPYNPEADCSKVQPIPGQKLMAKAGDWAIDQIPAPGLLKYAKEPIKKISNWHYKDAFGRCPLE